MTAAGTGLDCCARVQLGALDLDVSIGVTTGELVVLVGPNGAGKSTLLRAIAGLQPVDSGRIELDGECLDDPGADRFVPARDRSIGVVFQEGLLFDHMTVTQNVAFGPRSRGTRRRAAADIAATWLERFGLSELATARPPQLSGGQAQRIALARALAFTPRLLLLDEPFSALDATTKQEVRRDLRRHLAELDIPKIVVTHDPIDAITLADRIVVLERGRVTQEGTPEGLRTRPRSPYVADLLGVNLVRGTLDGDVLEVPGGGTVVVVNRAKLRGAAAATIHPRTVTLHRVRPEGSARNVWATTVDDLDHEGECIRVRVGAPIPLAVEITPAAGEQLELAPGSPVWLSFKATDVAVQGD